MSHLSETHLDHLLKKWSTFYRKKSIPMSHFWKLGYFLFHNLVTLVTGHVIPGPDVATANCQPPPLLPNGERSTSPSTAEGSRNVRTSTIRQRTLRTTPSAWRTSRRGRRMRRPINIRRIIFRIWSCPNILTRSTERLRGRLRIAFADAVRSCYTYYGLYWCVSKFGPTSASFYLCKIFGLVLNGNDNEIMKNASF